jgi:hypothetical protein
MKKGDIVTWKSRSTGFWVTRSGEIVEVVPAGVNPYSLESFPYDQFQVANASSNLTREHESYLVAVSTGGSDGTKKRLYWPQVSALSFHDVTGGIFVTPNGFTQFGGDL